MPVSDRTIEEIEKILESQEITDNHGHPLGNNIDYLELITQAKRVRGLLRNLKQATCETCLHWKGTVGERCLEYTEWRERNYDHVLCGKWKENEARLNGPREKQRGHRVEG